jgi:hypothetical protein
MSLYNNPQSIETGNSLTQIRQLTYAKNRLQLYAFFEGSYCRRNRSRLNASSILISCRKMGATRPRQEDGENLDLFIRSVDEITIKYYI